MQIPSDDGWPEQMRAGPRWGGGAVSDSFPALIAQPSGRLEVESRVLT